MKAKVILIVVLVLLLAVLLLQNTQEVVFRVFFWTISMSQVILVPLAVFIGFVVGYIVARTERKRAGRPEQK